MPYILSKDKIKTKSEQTFGPYLVNVKRYYSEGSGNRFLYDLNLEKEVQRSDAYDSLSFFQRRFLKSNLIIGSSSSFSNDFPYFLEKFKGQVFKSNRLLDLFQKKSIDNIPWILGWITRKSNKSHRRLKEQYNPWMYGEMIEGTIRSIIVSYSYSYQVRVTFHQSKMVLQFWYSIFDEFSVWESPIYLFQCVGVWWIP